MNHTLTMKPIDDEEILEKPRVRMEAITQPYKANSSKQTTTRRPSASKVREQKLVRFKKRIEKRFHKRR